MWLGQCGQHNCVSISPLQRSKEMHSPLHALMLASMLVLAVDVAVRNVWGATIMMPACTTPVQVSADRVGWQWQGQQ